MPPGALGRRDSCASRTPAMSLPGINLSQRIKKSTLHAERYQSEPCFVVLLALPGCCPVSAQAEVLRKEIWVSAFVPRVEAEGLGPAGGHPGALSDKNMYSTKGFCCTAAGTPQVSPLHPSSMAPRLPFCLQSAIPSFHTWKSKHKQPWGILGTPTGILPQMEDLMRSQDLI